MDTTEDFFSQHHVRLLNFASWARSLAWIALIVYVIFVGIQIIRLVVANDNGNIQGPGSQSILTMLVENPLILVEQLVSMAMTLIRGIIYFMILKGVSLGLQMIVETDINYRENGGHANGE